MNSLRRNFGAHLAIISAMNSVPPKELIEALYSASDAEKEMIAELMRNEKISDLSKLSQFLSDPAVTLSNNDIGQSVLITDHRYPALLRQIYAPPLVLFVKGNLPSDQDLCLAIVGARKAGPRISAFVTKVAHDMAQREVVIVSGLAYGIDAAAHRGALESERGRTIAVLGTPLDKIYPGAHTGLAEQILSQGGALISQYANGTRTFPSSFLERNRIIAGMSRAVVVAQAGERSGSLATARFALEENRDVMAFPGDVLDESFAGSNRLVRGGATLVASATDILEPYADLLPKMIATNESRDTDSSEEEVPEWLNDLGTEPIAMIDFLDAVPQGINPHEALLQFELRGDLIRLAGDLVQRI